MLELGREEKDRLADDDPREDLIPVMAVIHYTHGEDFTEISQPLTGTKILLGGDVRDLFVELLQNTENTAREVYASRPRDIGLEEFMFHLRHFEEKDLIEFQDDGGW